MTKHWTVTAAFADTAPPLAHVNSPSGGESFTIGSTAHLTWSALDNVAVTTVDLYLSRTGAGGTFDSIATALPNSGSYDWTVTGPATTDAYLKVIAHDSTGNLGWALSDTSFEIRDSGGVDGRPVTLFELPPVWPNPSRGAGRVGFAVPRTASVRLSVLDVQGREVAVLAEGVYDPGRYQVVWDGSGRGGVSPGLYFVRLSVPGQALVRRIVVTK